MNTERRYLYLNAYLRNSGYHEAVWRVSAADPAGVPDPRHYIELARTAERGTLDSIFLPDSPGVAPSSGRNTSPAPGSTPSSSCPPLPPPPSGSG